MKKHRNYLAIITILLFNFSIYAIEKDSSDLSSIIGTLRDVNQMVISGKKFAESKYQQHSSSSPGTKTAPRQMNLIGGVTAASEGYNPFVSIFQMLPDYVIIMKFDDNSNNSKKIAISEAFVNVTSPVAKNLLGVEFIFTPIYNKGDNKITTWACFTNADYYMSAYMKENTTPLYKKSYIADVAEQAGIVNFSKCIYMGPNLAPYITPYSVNGFGYINNNGNKK